MKILIAEQDYMMRELNRFFMEEHGFDYDMVDNGLDAVVMAESNKGSYDLCIMDIDMNVSPIDGLEALRRIRESDGFLPLLVVTVEDFLEDYCHSGIIDGCLYKPYDVSQLLEKIHVLSKKSVKNQRKYSETNLRREMNNNTILTA